MADVQNSLLWEERHAGSLVNGALLAVIGGFLDGFTYVGHGHVFANAMTGNVVLLGIYGIGQSWNQSLRHLPPILTFMLGICAARAILLPQMRKRLPLSYVSVVIIELLIIATITLLPDETRDFWITTSVAFAASMQIETFRVINGRNYNSTFTTGNLRSFSEGVFDLLTGHNVDEARSKARDFALICLCFLLGATMGGFSTFRLHNRAMAIDVILLSALLIRLWPRRVDVISSGAQPQPEAQRSDS